MIRNEKCFFEFVQGILADSHRNADGRSSMLSVGSDYYVVVECHSSSVVCRFSDHWLLADARSDGSDEDSFRFRNLFIKKKEKLNDLCFVKYNL